MVLERFQLNPDRASRVESAKARMRRDVCGLQLDLQADPEFTENALDDGALRSIILGPALGYLGMIRMSAPESAGSRLGQR